MLATTLGIEFDSELDWDEREQIFKMSGKIVRTANITQSAIGNKDGLWTTVFTAAVFINDDSPALEAVTGVVNDKSSLQEELLRQSLQGQVQGVSAASRMTQRNERPRRANIASENFASSAKKTLS